MLTGHSLRTASQSSLPARRRNTMASSSESKRASKYSPGDVGVNEVGTVKRRLESSVTIIVGLSHSSETAVKPAIADQIQGPTSPPLAFSEHYFQVVAVPLPCSR